MRWYLPILLIVAALAPLCAQDFTVTEPTQRQVPAKGNEIQTGQSIEGIVNQIFVTKKPWQLVNPAAPKEYGSGAKNVSKDFGPGTPYHSTGVVVANIEW